VKSKWSRWYIWVNALNVWLGFDANFRAVLLGYVDSEPLCELATAALAAPYAGMRVRVRSALMEVTLMMQLRLRSDVPRPKTWQLWKVPVQFTVLFNSS
jgi:hypothetical protein